MVSGVLVLVTLSFPDLRLQNIMTWRVWGSKAVVAWKPANLENEESRVPLALQGHMGTHFLSPARIPQ